MNDHTRQSSEFLKDAIQTPLRRAANAHKEDGHREGFTRAAGITLRRIQEKLDVFKEQMNGTGSTKIEQAIYTQLIDLKSEIEADCDNYWRGSNYAWRPRNPIARAVIRRTGESLSED